ncbi:MAG TPA: 7-cyano-7-deazaguanine synthase [Tepidisphaeraceae bacterium]|nr:7-cyano-7-deazaguanine synthase [Tepidisphaeraceae bacterium]
MAKDLAIILNSGSINSGVATALAVQKHRAVMVFVEVEQGPGSRARAAYDQQVAHFKPYREHTIPMPFLTAIAPPIESQSVVTDPRQPAPLGPLMLELLPLLAIAVRYAVHYHAAAIYTGLRIGGQGDELAQATEYTQIWNEMIQLPCGQPDLTLENPLLELEPWQVVDVGFQVNAPFERMWSCTEETSDPCWACRGCRAREAAFVRSGKPDPLRAVKRL